MKHVYGFVWMVVKPQLLLVLIIAGGILAGCRTRHMIIAATGTNIGVEISENPANQTPQAKLGYQRTELAIVPTNRPSNESPDAQCAGASEHGEVLMEIKHSGIFSTGKGSGIYQRLAVGKTAVRQEGAAFMFARDAKGNISQEVADALGTRKATESLRGVPVKEPGWTKTFNDLVTAYDSATDSEKKEVDAELGKLGLRPLSELREIDTEGFALTLKKHKMEPLIDILKKK